MTLVVQKEVFNNEKSILDDGCTTVEPRLMDTPEMRRMRTFRLARNAISIDLRTIRTPEIRTPRYSVKGTLDLVLTVSPPIQTHADALATNL